MPIPVFTKVIDVAIIENAGHLLRSLIEEMGGVDLFVISAGIGHLNSDLEWGLEAETIAVNVAGFACMANVAVQHLSLRKKGHLVGISSIAAIRGHGAAPAYGASKSFETTYLQAIRHRFAKSNLPICVTTIHAGFVDTAMAKGEGLFWVAPVEVAARQIFRAIKRRKADVYVTRRWQVIAWLLRLLPDVLYHKL